MNKRQAKKQFKKQYGCNPDEFMANLDTIAESLRKVCDEICEAMPKVINEIVKTIEEANKAIVEYVQSDEFKKIAQAISELELEKKEGDDT